MFFLEARVLHFDAWMTAEESNWRLNNNCVTINYLFSFKHTRVRTNTWKMKKKQIEIYKKNENMKIHIQKYIRIFFKKHEVTDIFEKDTQKYL